ncbi:coiled-coil domain-containing protein 149-like isoform X2 [Mytilus galloprovincialis]
MIISKELDHCRSERDQFKLMAEQLQERYQNIKRQLGHPCYSPSLDETKSRCSTSTKNLGSSLISCKERNKSLEFEVEDFKQKLHDANGDIKLLREQIARQRVGTSDEGINIRHFPAHEREDLVKQLEASREEINQLERDLQQVIDEKEELVIERVAYKSKYDRLNQELNYILKGDENRIVDIDALGMENKYLQESLKQMAEEKSMAMATVSKYKNLLERRKTKSSSLKLGQSRSGGLVITQKQVHQILEDHTQMAATPQAMSDLQALASALLETVNDKNLALSHQRKTNKILGNRVSELEKKIKTLEVAGLWNVPCNLPNLEKLRAECEDVKTLIPLMSQSSEDTAQDTGQDIDHFNNDDLECDLTSHSSSETTSPTHCSYINSPDNSLVLHGDITNTNFNSSFMQIQGVSKDYRNSAEFLSPDHNAVSLDDLDLLPTKEEIVKCTERDDLKLSNLLSSGGQLVDISLQKQQYEETVTESKLKSLMNDVTNKMVGFSHKTKSHGQFIIETSVDNNQQSEESQTDASMKSKNEEKKCEASTVACNNSLIKETLTHISNENEC